MATVNNLDMIRRILLYDGHDLGGCRCFAVCTYLNEAHERAYWLAYSAESLSALLYGNRGTNFEILWDRNGLTGLGRKFLKGESIE